MDFEDEEWEAVSQDSVDLLQSGDGASSAGPLSASPAPSSASGWMQADALPVLPDLAFQAKEGTTQGPAQSIA